MENIYFFLFTSNMPQKLSILFLNCFFKHHSTFSSDISHQFVQVYGNFMLHFCWGQLVQQTDQQQLKWPSTTDLTSNRHLQISCFFPINNPKKPSSYWFTFIKDKEKQQQKWKARTGNKKKSYFSLWRWHDEFAELSLTEILKRFRCKYKKKASWETFRVNKGLINKLICRFIKKQPSTNH